MEQVRAHVFIYGNVQGVFYRRSAKIKADELGVRGWVRNRDDGGVDIVCQGTKAKVDQFIVWCKKGPPLSKVEKVEVEWRKKPEEFEGFEIH